MASKNMTEYRDGEESTADSSARVLVVGPGALGRLLAGRWARAGLRVILLARTPAQESALSLAGIALAGEGRGPQVVRGVWSARHAGPADRPRARSRLEAERPRPAQGRRWWPRAAFFCVKAADIPAAIRSARPWIGPGCAVVGLQNGLGHEASLRRAFGPARTVIASCYVAAWAPDGLSVEHRGGRDIVLAANGSNGTALAAARSLLRRGGWAVRVERDEARMLWTKLVYNAAVNLLGTAAAATNGALAADPALAETLVRLVSEGAAVAKAAGHPLLGRPEDKVLAGCLASGRQVNSMLADLHHGRPTERRFIAGPLLDEARRRRLPAPMIGMLDRVVGRLEKEAMRRSVL